MDSIFERFNSRDAMLEAEAELLALRGGAVSRLEQLFDGSSRNAWGVPYRTLGLPLDCALETAARLGPIAKPLERHIVAEMSGHSAQAAARALGSLGILSPSSVEVLAQALTGDMLIASEAAAALVRCNEDRSERVTRITNASETAARRLAATRNFLHKDRP